MTRLDNQGSLFHGSQQLDLFDKPFHSVTVLRKPANGQRSQVVRYDNERAMYDDVERMCRQKTTALYGTIAVGEIAYVLLVARREGEGRNKGYDVPVLIDTVYPRTFQDES